MSQMSIGARIKDARNRRGLTQQELADVLGVALRTVRNWERGATSPRSKLPQLESVLNVRFSSHTHVVEVRGEDESLQVFYAKVGARSDPERIEAHAKAMKVIIERMASGKLTGNTATSGGEEELAAEEPGTAPSAVAETPLQHLRSLRQSGRRLR